MQKKLQKNCRKSEGKIIFNMANNEATMSKKTKVPFSFYFNLDRNQPLTQPAAGKNYLKLNYFGFGS